MWQGFDSACGLHINMLMTREYVYVPVFGNDTEGQTNDGQSPQLDAIVLTAIRANTRRTVVEVDVPHKVCARVHSVR
jgi:hypothetical protein